MESKNMRPTVYVANYDPKDYLHTGSCPHVLNSSFRELMQKVLTTERLICKIDTPEHKQKVLARSSNKSEPSMRDLFEGCFPEVAVDSWNERFKWGGFHVNRYPVGALEDPVPEVSPLVVEYFDPLPHLGHLLPYRMHLAARQEKKKKKISASSGEGKSEASDEGKLVHDTTKTPSFTPSVPLNPFPTERQLAQWTIPGFDPRFVIYQDPDMVVCFKPQGISSGQNRSQRSHYYKDYVQTHLGQTIHMPGRLDYDTAGLMIFSLSARMNRWIQFLFHHKQVQKTYVFESCVRGSVSENRTCDVDHRPPKDIPESCDGAYPPPSQTPPSAWWAENDADFMNEWPVVSVLQPGGASFRGERSMELVKTPYRLCEVSPSEEKHSNVATSPETASASAAHTQSAPSGGRFLTENTPLSAKKSQETGADRWDQDAFMCQHGIRMSLLHSVLREPMASEQDKRVMHGHTVAPGREKQKARAVMSSGGDISSVLGGKVRADHSGPSECPECQGPRGNTTTSTYTNTNVSRKGMHNVQAGMAAARASWAKKLQGQVALTGFAPIWAAGVQQRQVRYQLSDGSVTAQRYDRLRWREDSEWDDHTDFLVASKLSWLPKQPSVEATRALKSVGVQSGSELVRSLWCAQPHSGRTHQIRVHSAAHGVPVLGDPFYGNAYVHDELTLPSGLWLPSVDEKTDGENNEAFDEKFSVIDQQLRTLRLMCFQLSFPHPFLGVPLEATAAKESKKQPQKQPQQQPQQQQQQQQQQQRTPSAGPPYPRKPQTDTRDDSFDAMLRRIDSKNGWKAVQRRLVRDLRAQDDALLGENRNSGEGDASSFRGGGCPPGDVIGMCPRVTVRVPPQLYPRWLQSAVCSGKQDQHGAPQVNRQVMSRLSQLPHLMTAESSVSEAALRVARFDRGAQEEKAQVQRRERTKRKLWRDEQMEKVKRRDTKVCPEEMKGEEGTLEWATQPGLSKNQLKKRLRKLVKRQVLTVPQYAEQIKAYFAKQEK